MSAPQRFVLFSLMIFMVTVASYADLPRTIYAINESAETLSKMELGSVTIQQNILSTRKIPNQIAVHNNLLYVVNSGTDDIQVIDPQTDTIIKTIALPEGSNPWAIGFVGANKAYVTNMPSGAVPTGISPETTPAAKSMIETELAM